MSVVEKVNSEIIQSEKKEIIQPKKMGLLVENPVYKPFRYPWCYDAWLTQQRIHWLPEEVPLGDDVRDWQKNLSQSEKNLLTQIFRFFTQADVEVNNCYLRHYTTVFKPTEVLMMMTAFAAMETVHVAAYSHLLDNVGEVSKVDALQDAAAPKVTVVPVAQKISASISASLSSVRDTLNKTLFNPDIIKSIGEKIPFKSDIAERVETPKKAPVSKRKPATKKQASVSTKEMNAGRSSPPRPRKSARNSPPKKWYED